MSEGPDLSLLDDEKDKNSKSKNTALTEREHLEKLLANGSLYPLEAERLLNQIKQEDNKPSLKKEESCS